MSIEHSVLEGLPYCRLRTEAEPPLPANARLSLTYQMCRTLNKISGMFGVRSIDEVGRLITQGIPPEQTEKIKRGWVESHGLVYTPYMLDEAFEVAEQEHEEFAHPQSGLFANDYIYIAAKNEAAHERDPIKLLLYAITSNNAQLAFEAGRKLYLADQHLSAEKARKDEQVNIDYLDSLLNRYMFTPKNAPEGYDPGNLTDVHYLSYHYGPDFKCQFVRKLAKGEKIDESLLTPDMRVHTARMRTWFDKNGKPHKVMIEPRVKSRKSFGIKMLRNDTTNPQYLDDNLGIKLTFETVEEAELFLDMIQQSPDIPLAPVISGVSYTIKDGEVVGKEFKGRHKSSSKDLEFIKYHLTIGGTLYEFQANTIRTWIDSQWRDGICWQDYAVKRVVKPDKPGGIPIVHLLYPPKRSDGTGIYPIDLVQSAEKILAANKSKRRNTPSTIPKEIRRKGRDVFTMTEAELETALINLANQIEQAKKKPDYIVIAEVDPNRLYTTALKLAVKLGLTAKNVVSSRELPKIPKGQRVLIFDDMFVRARHIYNTQAGLERLGFTANLVGVATLFVDKSVTKRRREQIFHHDEINTNRIRILFPFEAEKRITSHTTVYLITRKSRELKKTGNVLPTNAAKPIEEEFVEVLVEETLDGRIKLPGGKIDNGTSPLETAMAEIDEELGIRVGKTAIASLNNGVSFRTIMEPHPDLTKPHSLYSEHHVFRAKLPGVSTGKTKLPPNFRWVKIPLVKQQLRWRGQIELWNQMQKAGIIGELENITSAANGI